MSNFYGIAFDSSLGQTALDRGNVFSAMIPPSYHYFAFIYDYTPAAINATMGKKKAATPTKYAI